MRHAVQPQRHPLAVAALAALLCGLAPAARASDAHAAPAHAKAEPPAADVKAGGAKAADAKAADAKATDMKAADAKTAGPAPAAAQKPARPTPGKDPLDVIRERLAEKLGAAKPPEAAPNVLRVVSKVSATPSPTEAVHASPARPARSTVAAMPAAAAALAAAHRDGHSAPAHWDYGGSAGSAGPEVWAQMKPEFSTCGSGTRQSPIDIRDGIKVNLDPVQFDYKPSAFRVVDNGHTVQVNVGPGNSIEVMGRRYDLLQFHFHRPSEERINGKQFDMVAHLVHKDLDGRLAVVAVLLERGSAHPLVQSVWNNLPLEKGEDVAARTTLDMNTLLPTERSYFTYMGSLTTPPCSEGVLWMVMKTPMPIAPDQIGVFSRLYPMNARPIQSVAGRLIKESN